MVEQPLDLRRSVQIVRRHLIMVGIAAVIGAGLGVGYAQLKPPLVASTTLIAFPPSVRDISTEVVIAGSDQVLARALRSLNPRPSLLVLQSRVKARSVTNNIVSITAQGNYSDQAEDVANAVTASFIAYLSSNTSAAGKVPTKILQAATPATGMQLSVWRAVIGGTGALVGILIGVIAALGLGRGDRRLRWRDEIADAIGVPVLASLSARHPTTASSWARLLEDYEPGPALSWRLSNAMQYLGLVGDRRDRRANIGNRSLAVVSVTSDKRALSIGPQLAVFAASRGVRTELLIDRHSDTNVTATLRAACAAHAQSPTRAGLRVSVEEPRRPAGRTSDAALTIAVVVLDDRAPQVEDVRETSATVVAVSAGALTAEQLARIAAAAGAAGHHIDGILVADPDSSDPTTGRIPQLVRSGRRDKPTRLTGTTTGPKP
jgi:capsular polysaccharide biosynthesis protein